jgi:RHS repeat-associated protein
MVQWGAVDQVVHDPDGNRIAEYDYDSTTGTSTLIRQYIWMEGRPVAVVEGGQIYFIRTDHIGRSVFATNDLGVKVWEVSYLPFGGVHVSTGGIDLRFPGQWFQAESGLHQNWMRDYDPTTGRYLQADPLGLVDGASVYGYAGQNPGRFVDPRGEEVWIYSSDAWGIQGLNHAFAWGDDCLCGIGTNGTSGSTLGDGVGDLASPRRRVNKPDGMSDEEFIDRLSRAPVWNNGIYFPFLNDCHNDLERAFRYNGFHYPGAPISRFDFDNNLDRLTRDWFRSTYGHEISLFGG